MARLALERALPAHWIDEVFDEHRQRQYPRELLFSTVVELMTLVTLGLRPSLHAAARQMDEQLPVSLAALYDKVNRTEPAILRALVQGSAQRAGAGGRGVERAGELAGLAIARVRWQPPAGQREAAGGAAWVAWCGAAGPYAGGLRPGQRSGVRHRLVRGRIRERAKCRDGVVGACTAQAGMDGRSALLHPRHPATPGPGRCGVHRARAFASSAAGRGGALEPVRAH
jgi:hypothetical protein